MYAHIIHDQIQQRPSYFLCDKIWQFYMIYENCKFQISDFLKKSGILSLTKKAATF